MNMDTAIPIEEIGRVGFAPGSAVVDLGMHDSTILEAHAGKPGAAVRVMVQMDLSDVPNAVDVVEFVIFHIHQLADQVARRMP
jgi:hypothetical protein